jgi:hypothetical protein
MGKDMEPSKKFSARRLKCGDSRIRNKYILDYETYIEGRDIQNKARDLQNSMLQDGWSEGRAQEYKNLDELREVGSKPHIKHSINCIHGGGVTDG